MKEQVESMTLAQDTADAVSAVAFNKVAQLVGLEMGESHAVAQRINIDHATRQTICDATEELRNNFNTSVTRAMRRSPGLKLVVEYGDYRTRSGHLIIVVTATRTA